MPPKPFLFQLFAASTTGVRLAEILGDHFRGSIHDADRIPREGPALLVGNHGLFGLDSVVFTAMLVRSGHRPPRFLGEKHLFRVPGLRSALEALGAIAGRPDEAVSLLEAGELVCVYPGGIDDSFKLSTEAYTLKWGTRAGFARVALRARAPIVPVAATGIDELFDVPRRESFLGRTFLGSRRYDLPLPVTLLPRRVPLDYFVLPPIEPSGDARDEEAVEGLRRATHDAIDGVLEAYRAGRTGGASGEPRGAG
jgi:1-acyl-sn-glycerol-3-phosphate acyltransferase